jgi:hypothetical protein
MSFVSGSDAHVPSNAVFGAGVGLGRVVAPAGSVADGVAPGAGVAWGDGADVADVGAVGTDVPLPTDAGLVGDATACGV